MEAVPSTTSGVCGCAAAEVVVVVAAADVVVVLSVGQVVHSKAICVEAPPRSKEEKVAGRRIAEFAELSCVRDIV